MNTIIHLTRGLKNNNPGNIKEFAWDKTPWLGERATDDDPLMEEFDFMWQGVRAAKVVFQTYARKHGLNTVKGLISRWAPPTENNTAAYIAAVCDWTGVKEDDIINVFEPVFMSKFLRAVFHQENGAMANEYVTDNDMHMALIAA